MFDIGWTELLVIGIVALIVVGPKDLPGMFRTLGKFTARARGMARDFQRAMEDAADETGVKDVSKTLRAATNPAKTGFDAIKEATNFGDWDPDNPSQKPRAVGSETAKLTQERAEAARKIHAATAAKAQARADAAEAEAKAAAEAAEATAPKTPAAKKSPAKKPAAKKAAAKKPAAKKPAAKKPAAKKPAPPKDTA